MKIVREVMNEAREPKTVAVDTMNHPFGKPYTKPTIVMVVEYPIIGGKAQINVRSHSIIHPAVTSSHFAASGASQPKIFSLYIKNRISRM